MASLTNLSPKQNHLTKKVGAISIVSVVGQRAQANRSTKAGVVLVGRVGNINQMTASSLASVMWRT